MSSANLDINGIISLVSLGLKVASAYAERRGKPISTLTKADIDAMIDEISIRDERELFSQGAAHSAQNKSEHHPSEGSEVNGDD